MRREEWRFVQGYEEKYMVSSIGRVKRLPCYGKNISYLKQKVLKLSLSTKGYVRVRLNKKGVYKEFKVHRLVAEAFIPNTENKPQINHKDGDKRNNSVGNIEWCTCSENIKHAYSAGLRDNCKRPNSKLTEKDVLQIREKVAKGEKRANIATRYCITASTVSHIVKRITWKDI